MGESSTLVIPVESRVRELDAKLLLAAVAAERGFPVVFGSRPFISFALPSLPRGVFFAKSMRSTSDLMTGFIRGFGHHMVASDEESLVRFDHPDYCAWRFSERTFGALEHVFAWGQDDAALFRAYPGRGGVAIHATGNPRVDLLREEVRHMFDDAAAQLRRQHGRFILVNTNFSFVNNFVAALNLVHRGADGSVQVGRTGLGMSLEFAVAMSRHQKAILEGFQVLMPALARAFPDRTIVLRPHPSEDHEHWRRLTAHLDNVRVLHEGNVVPWLMATDVLVHNGCTTAVEGAVLGTPAVAYRPVESPSHDYHLPNSLSVEARSIDEVLSTVADALAGSVASGDTLARRRLMARHLEMTPDGLAADRIVDVLVDAGYLESCPPHPAPGSIAYAWLGTRIRTAVKRVNMHRRGHRNGAAYLRHRFPPLDASEVNERLAALGRVTGRFRSVRAVPLGRDVFAIDRRRHGGWDIAADGAMKRVSAWS